MTARYTPTRAEIEDFVLRQRQASGMGQPIPPIPEEWTLNGSVLRGIDLRDAKLQGAALREADLQGAEIIGADLRDSDLEGADLRGTRMIEIDLRGTKLTGVRIDEGVVVASAAGLDGGYLWHALRVEDGNVVLQYGGERATLDVWCTREPNYGSRHTLDPEHWTTGPAVAIAAAGQLATHQDIQNGNP